MILIVVNVSLFIIIIIIIINTLFYKMPFYLHQVQNKTAYTKTRFSILSHMSKRGKCVKTHNST